MKCNLLLRKNKKEIMDRMSSGDYHIQFFFKMADSWSKKKKEEMLHKPHLAKPDIDNLYKAFTDSLFYSEENNDSEIWVLSASKYWGNEDKIVFISDGV